VSRKPRLAVVGAGVSGLVAAWLLGDSHEVTLFEAGNYLGGHTNTVDVHLEGKTHPVDTGFLVFNEKTYPNLIGMFDLLGVDSVETEMSFAVSLQNPVIEWAGSSLTTLFGQKRNLARPRFWAMLADILRFNRASVAVLAAAQSDNGSLRDYLDREHYSSAFSEWYLLPMAAAIWSCPTRQMLDMPLATFVRFCDNHGLLQITNRPLWRTVKGGGREYVSRIAARLKDVRLGCPVVSIEREAFAAPLFSDRTRLRVNYAGSSDIFDKVVMACHSDQALAILGASASEAQREVLSAVRYQPNRALLHTDRALLPRDEKLWSAWNYFAGNGEPGDQAVGVSYLINRLQPLPFKTPVLVSLNPAREPNPSTVIAEFEYAHPMFDGPAITAQQRLNDVTSGIQGDGNIWLCGAWSGYGFHEDGVNSAVRVAASMGVRAPWLQSTAAPRAAA